ncbi:myo-inositol-1(or 4)-monophosphatase [Microbacterium halimionae]|uniref:Inositol-1-monophosphatase n=1 Tax=Microbacterium halimionae TaxID=1526413 RepID=A0A7W3JM55_9MICO|nr:inositol monophosphatase family protein [Microbacterium halimionae]MBA8815358.1 myo-inositol-1(or 4)-monophosphatase [Microbacterium halimionae]NII93851.1 myo-inositol-1(or 4)-monophosphatase [Microbacterium halimionae]
MNVSDLLPLAIDIAREAGALAARRRSEGVAIAATKSAIADIVTEADREVESFIRARLQAERPDDGFLGEESGAGADTTGITWVVDPIDGTVNYAYGIPSYAVSIAAVSASADPETWVNEIGVVFNPMSGELFHATRGGGAWLGGTRLQMNSEPGGAGALLATGFGYDPTTHAAALERLARVMPLARDIRRIGAASLDLAFVAAGRLDAYYERGLHPWDHAAGALLVSEAGGRVGGSPGGRPGRDMTIAAGSGFFDRLAAAIMS